jgi:hypothetical protein
MVLLFVVCGWREETVAGVCQRTYLVHYTYVFFCTRGYGKIVNPAVQEIQAFLAIFSDNLGGFYVFFPVCT